jgi:hypothetical protein
LPDALHDPPHRHESSHLLVNLGLFLPGQLTPTARRGDIRSETLHKLPRFFQAKSAHLSKTQYS